jgi:glutamate 5-kinase
LSEAEMGLGKPYKRIVIKLGTSTLTAGTTHLSPPRLVELVRQMSNLHDRGLDVIVVTSGAIAVGRERLNFPLLQKDIPAKQMLAAVGQPRLMAIYEQLFGLYGLTVAQVLLTRTDLSHRRSYLNSRSTLVALLGQGIVPIVNENDTVATEEIRVGDNDNLSALVANLIEADLLLLLTDQPGLFTADPRSNPSARLIAKVDSAEIPEELWQAAGGTGNHLGTGGMITKLQAADLARRSGATVIIARGGDPDVILRLVQGEDLGTCIFPVASTVEGRKRYLLAGNRAAGIIGVDDGAAQALRNGGSLLPVGVLHLEGNFERGDTVRITGTTGREIARGLVNYASADLVRIIGHRSDEIGNLLGFDYGDEVIHRNNMVLL